MKRCRQHGGRRPPKGFTTIEVMVALVMVVGSMLAMGATMVLLAREVGRADVRSSANELAAGRIEDVKAATRYAAIDTVYPGVENPVVGHAGFSRQTIVRHVGGGPGDFYDYRVVTVVVSSARLPNPVRKTTVIAAF